MRGYTLKNLAAYASMKLLMLKQKVKNITSYKLAKVPILVIVLVLALGSVATVRVRADQFDEQIKALNQDNAAKQGSKAQLGAEAASLSDAINKLQVQINTLQSQIDANKAQIVDLQNQITKAEADLAKQKQVLGENIKAMYLEGQISTLEMLASSKDLSDFVDKQQYRNSVQDKIKTTLDRINELKHQLKDNKDKVEASLKDQQAMQDQLGSQQSQQSQLLSANVDQQNTLNTQIRQNSTQIAALRAAQATANRKLGGTVEAGDPGHGGYPANWERAPEDSLIDNWGMYNRECVSYTAWKVFQMYGHMPYWGGHGNANQWPASAQADGIPTGSEPRANSVAISMNGYYGHAMWVEYVLPNGYIHVSQFNYDLQGHYSEMTIDGAGLTYLYFN